jgi:hypothetical protein
VLWQRKVVPLAGITMLLTGCATTPENLPTTAAAASPRATCSTSQLLLSLDRVVPGLAQQPGAFFQLKNISSTTCRLDGHPTLQPIAASGQVFGAATRDGGPYQIGDPGPHTVILAPDSSASFGYGREDVTQPEGSTAGCVNTIEVQSTPPGSTLPLKTAARLPSVCPGGFPSVTAVALKSAFTTAMSPATP